MRFHSQSNPGCSLEGQLQVLASGQPDPKAQGLLLTCAEDAQVTMSMSGLRTFPHDCLVEILTPSVKVLGGGALGGD